MPRQFAMPGVESALFGAAQHAWTFPPCKNLQFFAFPPTKPIQIHTFFNQVEHPT
jgi:hypothetical protein